jgi:hypothetical protein
VEEQNKVWGPIPKKKEYQEPRLRVYGDLTTVTRTVAVAGIPDGNNKGSIHKTA